MLSFSITANSGCNSTCHVDTVQRAYWTRLIEGRIHATLPDCGMPGLRNSHILRATAVPSRAASPGSGMNRDSGIWSVRVEGRRRTSDGIGFIAVVCCGRVTMFGVTVRILCVSIKLTGNMWGRVSCAERMSYGMDTSSSSAHCCVAHGLDVSLLWDGFLYESYMLRWFGNEALTTSRRTVSRAPPVMFIMCNRTR